MHANIISEHINKSIEDKSKASTLSEEIRAYPCVVSHSDDNLERDLTLNINQLTLAKAINDVLLTLAEEGGISQTIVDKFPAAIKEHITNDRVYTSEVSQIGYDALKKDLAILYNKSLLLESLSSVTLAKNTEKRKTYLKHLARLVTLFEDEIGSFSMLDEVSNLGDQIDDEINNTGNYIGRLAKSIENPPTSTEEFLECVSDDRLAIAYGNKISAYKESVGKIKEVLSSSVEITLSEIITRIEMLTRAKADLVALQTFEKDVDRLMMKITKDFKIT